MEYQKIINLLNHTSNQTTKFRAKNRVETNDDAREIYSKDRQIKSKISMLKSSLYDYSDAYILVKGTISISAQAGGNLNNEDKEVAFKNCAPSTDCISERNNIKIDHAKDIDVVMSIYNLIEYSDNYSKTSESLWQYYRDEPALTDAGTILSYLVLIIVLDLNLNKK